MVQGNPVKEARVAMEEPIFNFQEVQTALNNYYKFLEDDVKSIQSEQTEMHESNAIKFDQILKNQMAMDAWCEEMVKFLKRCGFYGFPNEKPIKVPDYGSDEVFSKLLPPSQPTDDTPLRQIFEMNDIRPFLEVGIKTWGDLKSTSYQEVFAIPKLGTRRIRRIIDLLKGYGITLVGVKDVQVK